MKTGFARFDVASTALVEGAGAGLGLAVERPPHEVGDPLREQRGIGRRQVAAVLVAVAVLYLPGEGYRRSGRRGRTLVAQRRAEERVVVMEDVRDRVSHREGEPQHRVAVRGQKENRIGVG